MIGTDGGRRKVGGDGDQQERDGKGEGIEAPGKRRIAGLNLHHTHPQGK